MLTLHILSLFIYTYLMCLYLCISDVPHGIRNKELDLTRPKIHGFFFKTPQVNLTCMSRLWIFFTRTCIDRFKKPVVISTGFLKPVIVRTGFKNPSMKVRVFLTCLADNRFLKPA